MQQMASVASFVAFFVSAVGLGVNVPIAETDLHKNGVPLGRRVLSWNPLREMRRIVFYFGDHERFPVADKAVRRARVFMLTAFASWLILVLLIFL